MLCTSERRSGCTGLPSWCRLGPKWPQVHEHSSTPVTAYYKYTDMTCSSNGAIAADLDVLIFEPKIQGVDPLHSFSQHCIDSRRLIEPIRGPTHKRPRWSMVKRPWCLAVGATALPMDAHRGRQGCWRAPSKSAMRLRLLASSAKPLRRSCAALCCTMWSLPL